MLVCLWMVIMIYLQGDVLYFYFWKKFGNHRVIKLCIKKISNIYWTTEIRTTTLGYVYRWWLGSMRGRKWKITPGDNIVNIGMQSMSKSWQNHRKIIRSLYSSCIWSYIEIIHAIHRDIDIYLTHNTANEKNLHIFLSNDLVFW